VKVLEIFDFDWTLFRSPQPPEGVARKTFLHSSESLEPPYVPLRPGSKFWIEETVREMRSATRRRDTIVALITARRAGVADRIEELLLQRGIEPDYFFNRPAAFNKDKDRVHFKRRMTLRILDQNPDIAKISIWEDEPEQVDSVKDVARRRGLDFEGNLMIEPGVVRL
jgi:hypothetical protein